MHDTSLSKIESASSFLLWFRSTLPQEVQQQLRPYLAQPYQSALKVLDCCSGDCLMSVEEIEHHTRLSRASIRQILKVLRAEKLVIPLRNIENGR